jgi:hypothetical protein
MPASWQMPSPSPAQFPTIASLKSSAAARVWSIASTEVDLPKSSNFTLAAIVGLLAVGFGSASTASAPVPPLWAFAQLKSPLQGWGLVQPPGDCWHDVIIRSDPPGARVYGEDGRDWGETTNERGVSREFTYYSRDWDCSATRKYTVTLKKRGYKPTSHTYTQHYYITHETAEEHTEDLTIIVDTQSE